MKPPPVFQDKVRENSEHTIPPWTLKFSLLSEFTCLRLVAPANGEVFVSGRTVGSVASYRCNNGFILVGDSSRRCVEPAGWTGSDSICQRKNHTRHQTQNLIVPFAKVLYGGPILQTNLQYTIDHTPRFLPTLKSLGFTLFRATNTASCA